MEGVLPIPSCPLFLISYAVLVVVDIAVHSVEVFLVLWGQLFRTRAIIEMVVPAVVTTITIATTPPIIAGELSEHTQLSADETIIPEVS